VQNFYLALKFPQSGVFSGKFLHFGPKFFNRKISQQYPDIQKFMGFCPLPRVPPATTLLD